MPIHQKNYTFNKNKTIGDEMSMLANMAHAQMKEWLLDCFNEEADQEKIKQLIYEHCVKAINKCYDGGFKQFIEDGLFEAVTI